MIGTDSQSSPITDYFESLGYSVEGTNGDRFVKNFSSVNEELNSLNDGVGMRDISNSGIFELKGNDVLDFLRHEIPNPRVEKAIQMFPEQLKKLKPYLQDLNTDYFF